MMLASISVPEILPELAISLAALALAAATRREQVKRRRAEPERERKLRRRRVRKRAGSREPEALSGGEGAPVYGAAGTSLDDDTLFDLLDRELGASAGPQPGAAAKPPPDAPRGGERYANVRMLNGDGYPLKCFAPDELAHLRVDIGALRLDSLVERAVAFPEDLLPTEDVWVDVLLSSSDFAVGTESDDLYRGAVVERRLLLPTDGGAAVAEDGRSRYVEFVLRAPDRRGSARARLSYLYRNTVLQSQRVDAQLGENLEVRTDFTLSTRLGADVSVISERPRVTVIANDSPGERHELTVRAGDADGEALGEPVTFPVEHQRVGPKVAELRKRLTDEAPRGRKQRRDQLIHNLRRIAPLGWDLYSALDPKLQRAVREVAGATPDAVLQVAMTQGSTFTLPWSFVYDIFLSSSIPPEKLEICPVVVDWDGAGAMVAPDARDCPHAQEPSHAEGVLCPFGFWGYRYSIELLSSTERPARTIRYAAGSRAVVGESERGIDRKRLAEHVERLAATFASADGGLALHKAPTVGELRILIEDDLPILYFLCHGERNGKTTMLGMGKNERFSPQDLIGWMEVAAKRKRYMWTDPRPLVFVNACGSAGITPEDLVDYLRAFVSKGQAAGFVGTEVRVEQSQAMELAQEFFAKLFESGGTVDSALRHVRNAFLADGNLFGLMYTPYCFADLSVASIQ